jgi:aerobic-type carbon monoxide dehydrogenase small subunit (CoxS/CutS family)
MLTTISFDVDGVSRTIETETPDMPLLYVLRNELAMNNPHFGCGLAQCGACTVHVDGVPRRSCTLPVSAAQSKKITTLVGLGKPSPHPIQQAMIDEQAFFCGYCLNGWVMTAAALVRDKPHATDAEIRHGLSGLKCRCGSHLAIIRAIKRVTGTA